MSVNKKALEELGKIGGRKATLTFGNTLLNFNKGVLDSVSLSDDQAQFFTKLTVDNDEQQDALDYSIGALILNEPRSLRREQEEGLEILFQDKPTIKSLIEGANESLARCEGLTTGNGVEFSDFVNAHVSHVPQAVGVRDGDVSLVEEVIVEIAKSEGTTSVRYVLHSMPVNIYDLTITLLTLARQGRIKIMLPTREPLIPSSIPTPEEPHKPTQQPNTPAPTPSPEPEKKTPQTPAGSFNEGILKLRALLDEAEKALHTEQELTPVKEKVTERLADIDERIEQKLTEKLLIEQEISKLRELHSTTTEELSAINAQLAKVEALKQKVGVIEL